MTDAYQPIDPAAGLPAIRVSLSTLAGRFLCRRVRPSFSPRHLIELMAEFRQVVCVCGRRSDAQVLTAEEITENSANLIRSGRCSFCDAPHDSFLQFQSNGLILSREADGWFVWLSPVKPDRYGDVMQEHLFWYLLDWTLQDCVLASQLGVPAAVVRKWRHKLEKPISPDHRKPRVGKLPAHKPHSARSGRARS